MIRYLAAAASIVVATPVIAQDCSVLQAEARQMCLHDQRNRAAHERIAREHEQDQEALDREAASNPRLAQGLEQNRIIQESFDCNDRHRAAGEYSPSGVFADCQARYNAEEAALNQERRQTYAAQQQAQAGESSLKFHYKGKYYIDPAVIQAISIGTGNYSDVIGKYVVVGMVPITQVSRKDGKYWGYMGGAAVCVSSTPIAIAVSSPVSVSGRVRGTTVSTVSNGAEQAQVNTVVIDDCRVGPSIDQDEIWAEAQQGQR